MENHVSEPDANEILQIIKRESPTPDGRFGNEVTNWINKMSNKAAGVAGEVGIATTGGILVELLKRFFGM